ncbi:hypothetical protein HYR99_05195 [Candidatus Poribacteria bacterium]|nr:hypothetical protein [Candidatus Poribacteria bacterium]
MQNTDTLEKIPEHFQSIEEAAEFWDTHSLADYEAYLSDVDDVQIDAKGVTYEFEGLDHFIVDLGRELGKQVFALAQQESLTTHELIRRWVKEKLAEVS